MSISDDPKKQVFTVTINNLTAGDSGYYWCGVEISRGSAVGTRVSLSVTEGVSTVRWVTVQIGGSVTILCSYDNMYQEQVKYWCKGWDWSSCSPKVRTNSPKISDEMSINDDPTKPVFTVTINNLRSRDSGYYWCGVEISGGSAVGTRVYLSVTQGVSTVNTVSVQRGGSVTIPCFYDNIYQKHEKYWCRGSDWSSCTPIVHTDAPYITGDVSIRDDPDQQVINVTMNNLTSGDSGYYWCGVEISRGSTVGTRVYLSVPGDDEEGGNNEKQRWEQVLDAALKAGTGVLYLICTIIAIQLHWSSCRKRGSNQREGDDEGGAKTGLKKF
ncbi:polymeric immunoglobulin receptor-like [Paramormyrops kingsleyae]|uniref:polymeric immunoglobulin receptor-like n=1 Tax=Paramormyrops kingsleyae TaxID=1676925 RepID=UPI003B9777CE